MKILKVQNNRYLHVSSCEHSTSSACVRSTYCAYGTPGLLKNEKNCTKSAGETFKAFIWLTCLVLKHVPLWIVHAVLWCAWKCSLIYTHKDRAFPALHFVKLSNAQQHYMQTSSTKFHPTPITSVDSRPTVHTHTHTSVKCKFHCANFPDAHNHSVLVGLCTYFCTNLKKNVANTGTISFSALSRRTVVKKHTA
jgi:hypothetical protein